MKPQILISSGAGNRNPADEALLAGAVRLLKRGAYAELVALSQHPHESARVHDALDMIPFDEIDSALSQSRLLVVVGDLRKTEEMERAARHVTLAKLASVPVALVSVRLGTQPETAFADALLQILAECESISTCDGHSAQLLSTRRGRRVDTTAPLELILAAQPARAEVGATIGVCEESLLSCGATEMQVLLTALKHFASAKQARVVLLAARAGEGKLPYNGFDRIVAEEWPQWSRAVTSCRVFIGAVDSVALHIAGANGIAPVAIAPDHSDLHSRLGMPDLAGCPSADVETWIRILEQAFNSRREEVRFRCSPLCVVAWRALGQIAEATRSHGFNIENWNEQGRQFFSQTLSRRLQSRLERGDVLSCESELQRWQEELQTQPSWAAARARVFALQGRDREARRALERALAAHPEDVSCLAALAMVAFRLGDYQTSESCWTCVAALEPDSPRASYQLGCLKLLQGSPTEARQAWQEAESRQPGYASASSAPLSSRLVHENPAPSTPYVSTSEDLHAHPGADSGAR